MSESSLLGLSSPVHFEHLQETVVHSNAGERTGKEAITDCTRILGDSEQPMSKSTDSKLSLDSLSPLLLFLRHDI